MAQCNPGWSISKKSVPLNFYWGEEIRKVKKGWYVTLHIFSCNSMWKKVCPIQSLPLGVVGSILECYTLVRTPPFVWGTADIFQGVKKQWPFLLHLNISCIPLRQFVWSLQICRAVSYTAASWLSFFMSMFHLICRKRENKKKRNREAGEPRYKSLFEICTPVIFLGLFAPSRNPPRFEKKNKLQKHVHWRHWKFTVSLWWSRLLRGQGETNGSSEKLMFSLRCGIQGQEPQHSGSL